MKTHDTLTVRLHVPNLPHAHFEAVISREVTRDAGMTFYSPHFDCAVILKRETAGSSVVKVKWGTADFPTDRKLTEEDAKRIIQGLINDLRQQYGGYEWSLT